MREVEALYSKPIRKILIELYVEHLSMDKIAEVLGHSRATLWSWRQRLGITDAVLQAAVAVADPYPDTEAYPLPHSNNSEAE